MKEKSITQKLIDKDFLFIFFNKKINWLDYKFKIEKINIYPIKKNFTKKFHLVIIYNIFLKNLSREEDLKKIKVVCNTKKDNSRYRTYKINKYFFENDIKVPLPLFYKKKLKSFFYKGITGQNLFEKIKKSKDKKELEKTFRDIAIELAKIHSLPQTNIFKKIKLNKKTIDPSGLLKKTPYQKSVFSIFKKINKKFKKINKKDFVVSHGDFHLENVIINKKEKVYLIDFSDSGLYPFTYDLGFFLKQFQHMSFLFLTEEEKKHLKNIFINTYLKKTGRKISPETTEQINLFKALVSLKSSIYYNSFDDPNKNEMIKKSLRSCEKTLENIDQKI